MTVHSELKPLRIPLHSKKTKRCPACRHILIKPEQKAQSVRFKIKLVAANYIPAMAVTFPPSPDSIRQRGASTKQAPAEDFDRNTTISGSDRMLRRKRAPSRGEDRSSTTRMELLLSVKSLWPLSFRVYTESLKFASEMHTRQYSEAEVYSVLKHKYNQADVSHTVSN